MKKLEKILLETLLGTGIDYIHNGGDNRIPGNTSLSIKNADGEQLLHRLDLMKIFISTGSACDGKDAKISHVIKAMNMQREQLEFH